MADTETGEERRLRWLHASRYPRYFTKRHIPLKEHDRWRKIAELLKLSRAARGRLEWIIWWEEHGKDVSLTCRHFGIARKTFYTWHARFEKDFIKGLEDRSRAPRRRRARMYTPRQYERIVSLRREHIRWGKMKLLELYHRKYPEDMSISSWKVQCIIEAAGLYYSPQKQARTNQKRSRARAKKKITELKRRPVSGFLLCLDTIVRH